ncbi:hypothetical protein [Mycobacterium lacus]|nr:hypothetical protein [Mycobacterium lacus]MCV7123563.1 hypothetical protein [Mycobacterium lacus]
MASVRDVTVLPLARRLFELPQANNDAIAKCARRTDDPWDVAAAHGQSPGRVPYENSVLGSRGEEVR